jgi:glycine/D-amino acid oxidase-like deaminating enzyme
VTERDERECDVLIVGGGFAGASTAYSLACAGITNVVLVERERTCGYHASGRNAAMCRQLTEDDQVTELTVRGAQLLREAPAEFGDVALLRVTGSVLFADSADQVASIAGRAAQWDLPHEVVTVADIGTRWSHLRGVSAAGAVHFPTDGVIEVHELLQGYLAGARSRGVAVEVGCEVIGFEPGERGVIVRTTNGPVRARCVVNAAGAWVGPVGDLAGASAPHYAPIKRHLHQTQPVGGLDRSAPFAWHIGEREFYVRPEGVGYLVSACDETEVAPCDAVSSDGAVAHLADILSSAAPGLADLGVARTWACLRTFAPSGRPVVDWDPDHRWLFWVAGLGGHGATASFAIGQSAASKITARVGARLAASRS